MGPLRFAMRYLKVAHEALTAPAAKNALDATLALRSGKIRPRFAMRFRCQQLYAAKNEINSPEKCDGLPQKHNTPNFIMGESPKKCQDAISLKL